MDRQDYEDSRARSFVNQRFVAGEYRVVDGHVRPVAGGKARTYMPMSRPELPAELAKAATGREDDVLRFVGTYGLLGFDQAWRYPEEVKGAQVLQRRRVRPSRRGDPLPWVVAHAKQVRLVLELLDALDAPAKLRALFETMKTEESGVPEYRLVRRGCRSSVPVPVTVSRRGLRNVALRIIEMIVSENLSGVVRWLTVGQRGLVSLFRPCNLADCAYWHLADAALAPRTRKHGWVRRCKDPQCGAYFLAKDPRVLFCPAPFGKDGVSPCMNRFKQREHRRKAKARRRG